jgi:serine/threonine protein kinase
MLKLDKDQILLSRFSLIQPLGEGGMGQVWLVRDLELQINIAIKALHPRLSAIPGRIELLKNECRNTRALIHPHIVRVFDFHRDDDLAFISMEYIEGQNLIAYRRNFKRPSYLKIISVLQPIVDALSYAHSLGLVHRDVKAGNILIDTQNSPRLTDFGIAGVFKSASDSLEITSGGSLYCMSPQQLDGQQPRPADDIYALGVLIYELLTGEPPFYPDVTSDKIRHHIPLPINQKLADQRLPATVPAMLEELVDKMLAKTARERPADMQEITVSLQNISQGQAAETLPPVASIQGPSEDRPLRPEAQIITPRKVPPNVKKEAERLARRQNLFKAVMLAFIFAGIVIGGGLLLFFLSKHPLETADNVATTPKPRLQSQKKPAAEPKVQPTDTPDPAARTRAKENAEQKLAQYIQLKNELERQGASHWGGDAYTQMSAIAGQADALLMGRTYESAVEKYSQAIAAASALANQTGDALEQLLQAGRLALGEGNGTLAQEKFRVALMIDPANAVAQRGLQRAKTIDTVMQLIASAEQHEKNNKLSLAHADYQIALDLDPDSKAAATALKRVKEKIRTREFQQLISDGLAAYHNNDYGLARTKLLKAKSLKPDSREVRDALTQVDTAIRLSQIDLLKQKAAASEQSEDWAQALNSYLQILKLDPNVQLALKGKKRTLQRIQIEKRINFFLDSPGILETDRQLENAVLLIQEINGIEPQGPKLASRMKKLEKLVTGAQTPVIVTIESDSFTDVAVYKVGKLGRFSVRQLDLRPGTYVVVGARDGYKDVRQKIVIKAGQKPLRITIKCTVKI